MGSQNIARLSLCYKYADRKKIKNMKENSSEVMKISLVM